MDLTDSIYGGIMSWMQRQKYWRKNMSLAKEIINECDSIISSVSKKVNEEFDADEFFDNAQITYIEQFAECTHYSVVTVEKVSHLISCLFDLITGVYFRLHIS